MKNALAALSVACFMLACAVTGTTSPEAQIVQGAKVHVSAATLTTNLLARRRITTQTAQSARLMLGTASTALDASAATLAACRTSTGTQAGAAPDPCAATVAADLALALGVFTQIESALLESARPAVGASEALP
jgi:hypothetical protein